MRRPSPLLLALALAACGPKPGDTDGDAASDAGTSETGASATATAGTTSDVDTTGATGGALCQAIADIEPSPAVEVTLRNAGAEPVFFVRTSGCDYIDPLAVAGPDGDTPVQWTLQGCSFTCSQISAGACSCPAACAQDSVLQLAPGGTYTITWSGARYEPIQAPPECVDDGGFGTDCLQVLQAAPGAYILTSVGGSEVTGCLDPNGCTCTPNDEGWCDILATGVGGLERAAQATLDYPGTAVELVF